MMGMVGVGMTTDPSVRDAETDQAEFCGGSTSTQSSSPHCIHLVVTPFAVKKSEIWPIVGGTSGGIASPLSVGKFMTEK
jgi:hypothetical protein